MQFDFTPDDDDEAVPEPPPVILASPEVDSPPPAAAAVPSPRKGREWLLGGVGIMASAAVTLMMLAGRSDTSSTAIAASTTHAPAARAAARHEPPPETRTWIAKRDTWLGRAKGVAYELPSETLASVWMRTVRPALIVRCSARKAEVFVFTDSPAAMEADTEDHTVTLTLDDEAPISERWPDAAEHNALFAPDGRALAARIMAAQRMRFSFTPHNSPTATVTFSVAGLSDLLAPAVKDCGF